MDLICHINGGGVKYRTFWGHLGHVPFDPEMIFLNQKLRKEISITFYQGFFNTFVFFMKILSWHKSAVVDPPINT